MKRLSVRWQLTLAYGCLFLLAGLGMMAASYALVRERLPAAIAFEPFVSVVESDAAVDLRLSDRIFVPPADESAPPGLPAIERVVQGYRSRTLSTLVRQSGIALAAATLASLGLGWIVAGRMLRPVIRITDTARRLSNDNLAERINLGGPRNELRELSDTFDAMLDRLQSGFDAERRFIANASHELRTPVANQRAVLEVALADPAADRAELRGACERTLTQVVRQQELIDGLFELARAGRPVGREIADDLADLARAALEAVPAGDLTVHADLRPAPVVGDPALLARVAGNLVENAVRHNRPGGFITVETASGPDGSVLRVINSGPVQIGDADVVGLFAPFRRWPAGDRLASDLAGTRAAVTRGLGLGLSIVRAVAMSHGASIGARPVDGGGLAVELRFPVAEGVDQGTVRVGSAGSPPSGSPPSGSPPSGSSPSTQVRTMARVF